MTKNIPFDSLNLHVGSRLQLLIVKDVKPIACFSTLVGFVRDEYLILKTPHLNKSLVPIREGETFAVRVFSGLIVGTFNVTVLRIFMQPVFYLHVSFPDTIRGSKLRSAMRVKVDLIGKIMRSNALQSEIKVRLADLSAVGALVESSMEIGTEGDEVEIAFTIGNPLNGTDTAITTKAVVRTAQLKPAAIGSLTTHAYGLEFKKLDQTDELILQNFTYESVMLDRKNVI